MTVVAAVGVGRLFSVLEKLQSVQTSRVPTGRPGW